MPHTKSAEKRARQYEKRRRYNRGYKKAIKEVVKDFGDTVKSGTPEAAADAFKAAVKKLDKAAIRRVIHPNKAARKKSQLARALAKKKTAPAAPPAKK